MPKQLPNAGSSWEQLVQVISGTSDIVVAFAAVGTVLAAWLGLSAWKRELRGRRRFEAAFELMSALITIREQFQMSRASFTTVTEATRAAKVLEVNLDGLGDTEAHDRMFGAAHLLRRNQVVDAWHAVQAKTGAIEILLGDIIEEPLIKIKGLIHEFVHACDMYGYTAQEKETNFQPLSPVQKQDIHRYIHARNTQGDPDKHAAQLNEAITEIRDVLHEHLG